MLKLSHGGSTIGCLLTIVIVVFGFYAGYKFAAVQWKVESFKEELTDVTRFWAIEKTSSADDTHGIKADVIRRGDKCGFSLDPENITVKNEVADVSITVSWLEPIEFPGGYIYERDIEISRSIRKKGR
jgi:hypothetical protein